MSLGPVTHLTIHCAATPEGRDVKAAQIEQWDTAKFGQKSYHWIVELNGNQHRSLEDDQLGAHVALHNHGNIGVCYIGGCDVHGSPKDTRTAAQIAALADLVGHYRTLYPGIVILGHRDWPNVHKACPSFSVTAWLNGSARAGG
jgi:N-acetyl-anhydromuramyl-L-alanine amidase AmpD